MVEGNSCEQRDWKRSLLVQVPKVKAEEGSVREAGYVELERTYQLNTDSIVSFTMNKFMQ